MKTNELMEHHKRELIFWKNQLNKKQYPQDLKNAHELIDYHQAWIDKLS